MRNGQAEGRRTLLLGNKKLEEEKADKEQDAEEKEEKGAWAR